MPDRAAVMPELASTAGLGVSHLSAGYPSRPSVISDISFELELGECVSLVGESGSGKSTLGLAVAGLLPFKGGVVDSGSVVRVGARQLLADTAGDRRMRGALVGMVFQDPLGALNPRRTIGSQFNEILRRHRIADSGNASRRIALAALEAVGIEAPAARLRAYPHELSGGMRQRVLIAMAMSLQPAVIIADEPTSALDGVSKVQVLDLLRTAANDRGMSLILITHDLPIAARYTQRMLVMYEGRIVEDGATSTLCSDPRHPYTQALLGSNLEGTVEFGQRLTTVLTDETGEPARPEGCAFAPRCPYVHDQCLTARPALKTEATRARACYMPAVKRLPVLADSKSPTPPSVVTQAVEVIASTKAPVVSARVVELAGVSKSFHLRSAKGMGPARDFEALKPLTIDIPAGGTLAVVGLSGSGKSTLARIAAFIIRPTQGEVHINGENVWALRSKERRARRRDLQIVFQDPRTSLDPRLSIRRAIAEPLRVHAGRSDAPIAKVVAYTMDVVELPKRVSDMYPHELSTGQLQRVALARAVILNPAVLILDEPTSALDASLKSTILNLLNDLRHEFGMAYLVVTHDLPAAKVLCEQTLVLKSGEVVASGKTAEVFNDPASPYLRTLLADGLQGAGTASGLSLAEGDTPPPF